jgi:probable HAF family extracellular repeat protein
MGPLLLPLSLFLLSSNADAQQYALTDLGNLGGTSSYAAGINASGQVTGWTYTTGNAAYHAFLYSSGTMQDLGTLGGINSYGEGINAGGQVTGYADYTTNAPYETYHAFLYSSGTMQDLGSLGGTDSAGYAINASGQATGYAYITGNMVSQAFLDSGGAMGNLGGLAGTTSDGQGINASGQVTGWSNTASGPAHAFLYTGGTMQDLGTLGGTLSYGNGINASGQVTGSAYTTSGAEHAFLYSSGTMQDLGTLGGLASYGNGINASGQVTGSALPASGGAHAFLYGNGTMKDLNTLDTSSALAKYVTLTSGASINDNGAIVANGTDSRSTAVNHSYPNHAYLLTPIPPPSILWQNSNGDVVRWFMNGGTISSTADFGVIPPSWSIQGTADFNGDGNADILWRNTTTGDVVIWFMNGEAISASAYLGTIPSSWMIQGTGNFNSDGKADILWRNSNGDVVIWFMNGGTIASSVDLGVIPSSWSIQGTGDFNADGNSDIVWRNTNSGDVNIWFMNGGTISSSVDLGVTPASWTIQATGVDGQPDIVWRNSNGDVVIWFMSAGTITSSVDLGVIPSNWKIQGTGDFNSDGNSDILWRNTTTGDVVMWLLNGGTIGSSAYVGTIPMTWTIEQGNGSSPPVIAVSGNRFVNAAGNTVELVGASISGLELQSSLWPGIAGLTSAQWQTLASTWSQLGQTINVIRLPLNSYSWLNLTCVDPGSGDAGNDYKANGGGTFTPDPTSTYQADVEQTVTAITAAGLYVILDLQWDAPNNVSGQPMCPVGQPAFASADHAPAFWSSVAYAFQGNAAVIFELFNEPFGDNVYGNGVIQNGNTYTPGPDAIIMANGGSWAHPFLMQDNANQNQNCGTNHNQSCQNELFNTNAPNPVQIAGELSLLAAIRATGASNVVLASPIGYAGEIETWLGSYASAGNPDPLEQFGVSWHLYGYAKGTTPPLSILAAGYPIVITETYGFDAAIDGGKNLNGYTWAAQNDIGYLWWGLNNWGDQSAPALYTKLAADVPWLDSTAP